MHVYARGYGNNLAAIIGAGQLPPTILSSENPTFCKFTGKLKQMNVTETVFLLESEKSHPFLKRNAELVSALTFQIGSKTILSANIFEF